MGLDMYIMEAEKISAETAKGLKTIDDCYKHELIVMSKKHYEENDEMMSDLLPFFTEVEILVHKTDHERFRKDYKIPDNYHQTGFSNGHNLHFTYSNEDHSDEIKIEIPENEYTDKYIYQIPEKCYVAKLQEIEYWRKHYDLQDLIYEMYHEYTGKYVDNCGFYRLTKEMIEEINYEFDENLPCSDDLYYHEWY